MAAEKPPSIGKYDVVDVIGRGGMGVVYKAKDPQLGRLVAIKMMTSGFDHKPEHLRRFLREAQSTASLQHPSIVTVYELGDYEGNPYLVMEYLDGHGLDVLLGAHQPPGLLEKLNIVVDICRGLGYAHKRNIIHRDIKPGNIMVLSDGTVKIVDFGIAHIGGLNETRTGQVMGSINYLSPEQVNGTPVDRRTDIFSTGVVLYQLLTYSLPFQGENTAATLFKIVHEPPPPLHNFLPIFPPELESMILRALSKDRDERYSSAHEFAVDLGRVRDQVRQEMLTNHLEQATALLDQNELQNAKEQVLDILKIDLHHTRASHLLREIQQRVERQQVCEQVRELTKQAEQSYQKQDFDKALAHVDRALAIAEDKLQLESLRRSIQAAEERAQNLEHLLGQAQAAYERGDLDSAKQAIDELSQGWPNNAKANALQQTIEKEWGEYSRQRQLEEYVRDARRAIMSRRFTAALEILKNAQALDPLAPHVLALVQSASAGRERERKRCLLDTFSRDIEEALSRDNYISASKLAAEGLSKFPDEPRLVKLLELAERQRRSRERKQFIDEQLTSARKLLEQGRSEELVVLLEQALNKIGSDTTLESLLRAVRQMRQREKLEKRKKDYLQSAKEQLRQKDYAAAIRTLEAARTELNHIAEIEDLLQFVRDEALAEERREKVAETPETVREMTAGKRSDEAITLLETTSKPAEALRLLEAESSWLAGDPSFQKLSSVARGELERAQCIEQAIRDARSFALEGQFDQARGHLEESESRYGKTPELEQEMAEVDRQQELWNSKQVQQALADSRTLVAQGQFATAIARLTSVSHLLARVPADLRRAHTIEEEAQIAEQLRTEIETQIAAGEIRINALEDEKARQGKQGQEQETAVLEDVRGADQEPAADGNVNLRREGLAKSQSKIEPSSTTATDLQEQLSRLVKRTQARDTEKQPEQAIREEQAVRAYSRYPDVDGHVRRLTELNREVSQQAWRDWLKKLEDAVADGDLEAALRLLDDTYREFPEDADLQRIHQKLQQGLKLRRKAEKALAQARRCFSKRRWNAGGKAIVRAFAMAKQDPVLWKQAIEELVAAGELARGEDSDLSERILREVSQFDSNLPLPALVQNHPAELSNQARESGWMHKLRSVVSSWTSVARDQRDRTDSTPVRAAAKTELNPFRALKESTQPSKDLDHEGGQGGRDLEFPTLIDVRSRAANASAGELVTSGAGSVAELGAMAPISKASDTQVPPEMRRHRLESVGETGLLRPSTGPAEPTRLEISHAFRWPEDTLRLLEKQLTPCIGPVTRILVKRAAAKTADFEELYGSLLASLDKESDREAFLRGKAEVAATLSSTGRARDADPTGLTRLSVGSAARELTQEAIKDAARLLARYVGPISSILVKKAAPRADSVRSFYLLLAEHVNERDRVRFLKEAGFADSSV